MTRRELLLAAAAAPLLAAVPARAASRHVELLAEAVRMERATAAFYAGSDLAPAAAFAAHEREHADALAGALEAYGGSELEPPRTAEEIRQLVPGLPADPARAAIAVEEAALAALDAVLRETDETELLRTVATIMAAAGTHLAVLRSRAATL